MTPKKRRSEIEAEEEQLDAIDIADDLADIRRLATLILDVLGSKCETLLTSADARGGLSMVAEDLVERVRLLESAMEQRAKEGR